MTPAVPRRPDRLTGTVPFSEPLAFDNAGQLFGSYQKSFYRIDHNTAQTTEITESLNLFRLEDLAFHPENNTLFALGYAPYDLFEIDPDTGQETSLGPSVFRPSGLAFLRATPGDTDGDGDVDDTDLGTAMSHYTGPIDNTAGMSFITGDTDNDGDIDDSDLGTAFANYAGPTTPLNVPEPAAASILAITLLALHRRKNRHPCLSPGKDRTMVSDTINTRHHKYSNVEVS